MFPACHVRNAAAGLVLAAAFFVAPAVFGRTSPDALPDIAVDALPREARTVLTQVQSGGPFPYERDGVVFGNRERLLPAHARGYYHEYTVPTPGVKSRGARRIVCGGPQRSPAVCYYTADHYQSFARIRE
jgi:ribonuclease T1